jgi:hypothetical protein
MKLYHWNAGRYDYLVMSKNIDDARRVLLEQVNCPAGAQAKALGHEAILQGEPTSTKDVDDALVIW